LLYNEKNISKGFPFTYSIQLEYVLTQNTLALNVEIKNTDSKIFPFTLGWHPYFVSENLYHSSLSFDCNRKIILDKNNITTGISTMEQLDDFQIKGQSLDDCFILNSKAIQFKTPKYNFELHASGDDNFLQLYTPPHPNTLAIEPTTGVSDSLNNKIGIKTLHPNEIYVMSWKIRMANG